MTNGEHYNKIYVKAEFFTATAEAGNPSRYIFLVEPLHDISNDTARALIGAIEEEMCRENSEYLDLRKQGLIGMPLLKIARCDEYQRFRATVQKKARTTASLKSQS